MRAINLLEAKTRVTESPLPGQYHGILCSIDSNDKDCAYSTKSTLSVTTVTIDIPIIIAGIQVIYYRYRLTIKRLKKSINH